MNSKVKFEVDELFNECILDNKEEALEALKKLDFRTTIKVSDELSNDKDFLLNALTITDSAIYLASDNIKQDTAFMLQAVNLHPTLITKIEENRDIQLLVGELSDFKSGKIKFDQLPDAVFSSNYLYHYLMEAVRYRTHQLVNEIAREENVDNNEELSAYSQQLIEDKLSDVYTKIEEKIRECSNIYNRKQSLKNKIDTAMEENF